ncbi:MAG: glycosidase [Bacteroidota bacterium]|nr:glycosidase [Bacteroidota bacterium]MDP4232126.1 glycosidase [Bacteroidota bacterium]MDP4241166.1 glycosidase [Bacteroidota bacterium]MDP4286558.1 glycosidase [Bacteroidota bacterium]
MSYEPLFHRYAGNPILTPQKWPYRINTVFNPGATKLKDGTTLLLCRVEDHTGLSHLTVAKSRNGIDNWEIDPTPTMLPDPHNYPEEMWGIEDPRITFVPELDKYVVTYVAYSIEGPGVSLAMTSDFRRFERLGDVMPPENKDAVILPNRVHGRWAMIHRPSTAFGNHIWMSYSPDLIHWGGHVLALPARRGGWWDSDRIGMASPPIETPEGWIMIYHGVRNTASGKIYRLGLALFDRENPDQCLLRGDEWIFGPEERYEVDGEVKNVVFPCGQTIGDDGDTIYLYYGVCDNSIALATGSIKTLLDWLQKNGRPPGDPVGKGASLEA